jgi:hypothetical protein
MPAKGGKADLSVEDFSLAVVYMAQAAGSKWKEPDAKMLAAINKEIAAREKQMRSKAAKAKS